MTPGCRNSGEATQRLGSITKQGSRIVRYLLGQAVVKVLRFDGVMRAWFKRIKKRRGSKIARVAVMRRMATIMWHMLKKKQKYRYELPIKKHQEFVEFDFVTVLIRGFLASESLRLRASSMCPLDLATRPGVFLIGATRSPAGRSKDFIGVGRIASERGRN